MIVKEPWLVVVDSLGRSTWLGDWQMESAQKYPMDNGDFVKVKHQLTCTECNRGVRAEDEHRCDEPD